MKISVIGAGNVGALTAMRLAQEKMGEVVLVDIVPGLAKGKALDLEDASAVLKYDYSLEGTEDFTRIKDSDIVVITAGLTRKPGMSREELLVKNSQILKEVCQKIKTLANQALVITVTNPLDLMTFLTLKNTGFQANRVLGMGGGLDAGRFAGLISKELNIPDSQIQATVIGSHGEGMLPLPKFTSVKGVPLDKLIDPQTLQGLVDRTVKRGAEIVSLLGSGSAYFAPSAAIAEIVRVIVKDEKRTLLVCAYLKGEYGISDICLGVPCRLGRKGIEEIIELELSPQEKEVLSQSAANLKALLKSL